MVLGSWVFDLEIRAWSDLTGGAGIGEQGKVGGDQGSSPCHLVVA